MKILIKSFWIFNFIFCTLIINAQDNSNSSLSPNTSGGVQSASIPVDMFTGTGNVTIPLFTVSNRGSSLPVSLHYNTSGIKVKQLSGQVGLGWSLNVGGSITRDVKGSPDEYMTFYRDNIDCYTENNLPTQEEEDAFYLNNSFPNTFCIKPQGSQNYNLERAVKGRIVSQSYANNLAQYRSNNAEYRDDTEADVFYLNCGDINAKFVLMPNGSVKMLSKTDAKIEYFHDYRNSIYERSGRLETFVRKEITLGQNQTFDYKGPFEIARFVVTSPTGVKYYFEAVERMMTSTCDKVNYEEGLFFGPNISSLNEYNSSWKLTKIENPYGLSLIDLEYEKELIQPLSNYINSKERDYFLIVERGNYLSNLILGWRIKKIKWGDSNELEAIFQYTKLQQDLETENHSIWHFNAEFDARRAKMVTEIEIKSNDPNSFQKYQFNYEDKVAISSQFNYARHFLSTINLFAKRGNDEQNFSLYTLGYDQKELSHVRKLNEDFWGYNTNPNRNFNQNIPIIYSYPDEETTNEVLKRTTSIFPRISGEVEMNEYDNPKDRNTDQEYIKAGILTSLSNASGLTTSFEYEVHDFIDPNVFNYQASENLLCKSNSNLLICSEPNEFSANITNQSTVIVEKEAVQNNFDTYFYKGFCIGIHPHSCLSHSGDNFSLAINLPGTEDNYLEKKLTFSIDIPQYWGDNCIVTISTNLGLLTEIGKSDILSGEFFIEIPAGVNNITCTVTNPGEEMIIGTLIVETKPKIQYNLQVIKSGVIYTTIDFNEAPNYILNLPPDQYTFRILNAPYYIADMTQKFTSRIKLWQGNEIPANITIFKGGGLRVKSITTNDGQNTITKEYLYKNEENTLTSGRLIYMPEFKSYEMKAPSNFQDWFPQNGGYNEPLNPFGSDQIINVAYQRIEEHTIKGKTVNEYFLNNNPMLLPHSIGADKWNSFEIPSVYFPHVPIDRPYSSRLCSSTSNSIAKVSQLKISKTYNSANRLISETTYNYALFNVLSFKNEQKLLLTFYSKFYYNTDWKIDVVKSYYHLGYDIRPTSSETKIYNDDGSSASSSISYEYRSGSSQSAIPKATTSSSYGITTREENTLIIDLPGYQEFKSKNMIYLPVETKSYVNGVQTGGSILTYQMANNGRILPRKEQKWFYDEYLDAKEYLSYNNWNQPTSIKNLVTGLTESIAYESGWDGVKSNSYNGRMVTYTYYPDRLLHTVTTSADQITLTHSYDALGRVKETKDNVTKLFKTYQYGIGLANNFIEITETQFGYNKPNYRKEFTASGEVTLERYSGASGNGNDAVTTIENYFSQNKSITTSTMAYGNTTVTYEASPIPSWSRTKKGTYSGEWITKTTFSGVGIKTEITDPDGRKTSSEKDGLGRIMNEIVYGMGASTSYDAFGRTTSISGSGGSYTYTYEYIKNDNSSNCQLNNQYPSRCVKTTVVTDDGMITVSKSNLKGEMIWSKDEKGREYYYCYNSLGLPTTVTHNGIVIKSFDYYPAGDIKADQLHVSTGKIITTTGAFGENVTETFILDDYGRIINSVLSSPTYGTITKNSEYSDDNFLKKISTSVSGGNVGSQSVVQRFTPDGVHRVNAETIELNGNILPVYSISRNDQADVITKILGGGLQKVDYKYNAIGWLTKINEIRDCEVTKIPEGDGGTQVKGIIGIAFDKYNINNSNIKLMGRKDFIDDNNEIIATFQDEKTFITGDNPINNNLWTDTAIYYYTGKISAPLFAQIILDDLKLPKIGIYPTISTGTGTDILTGVTEFGNELNGSRCDNPDNDAFAEEIFYNESLSSYSPGHSGRRNGMISGTRWRIANRPYVSYYAYGYNGNEYLTSSSYAEKSLLIPEGGAAPWMKKGAYDETVSYNGTNINQISRSGYKNGGYPQVDNIAYTYYPDKPHRVKTLTEGADALAGWKSSGNGNITYDISGNTLTYPSKGINIQIVYNILDLPSKIVNNKGTYEAIYDVFGRLWQYKVSPVGSASITRGFLDGFESMNGQVVAYHHGEGRHVPGSPKWQGEFVIRDHIGNVRAIVKDKDNNGIINIDGAQNTWEIIHEKHFYSFGLPMEGLWIEPLGSDEAKECRDGLNSIEYITALDLDMYFAAFRSQDPGIGRWLQKDPKAIGRVYESPYSSMGNNPVLKADPNGDWWEVLIGAVVGGISYSSNTDQHWNWEGFGSAVVMGAIGGLISYGIGEALKGTTMNFTQSMIVGAAAHGFTQGVLSEIQGGNFWQSALAGAGASVAGSFLSKVNTGSNAGDIAITTLGGATIGGASSWVSGGSFWNGFKTGLIVAGLNHVVHDVIRPQYKRLVFDGEKLSIYGRGKLLAEFDAVSGKALDDGTFDYSVERQKMSDVGPIPEGEYKINSNATQRWHSLGFWQKTAAIFGRGEFPGGTISWGAERVDIIPNGANTYGRYGFTIHGGLVPGSAGCIDLTQYDRQFFNHIRNSGYIRLTVKY